jgi:hypothetical protein
MYSNGNSFSEGNSFTTAPACPCEPWYIRLLSASAGPGQHVMLHSWEAEPDIWSGTAGEDLADYQAWLTECAIWEAMTAGQNDPPPAPPGRDK